jgi:branched-chain amino acid transport system ATP-binding protein
VTVRFGGLTAVENALLEVRPGEIVGLIGPNGAGKTTLFNAMSGLVTPASGTVALFGRDVTTLPVHERAALGLGRTFQIVQLFGELTVFENLLTATHLHARSGLLAQMLVTSRALAAEREARERVREGLALTGLQEVADQRASALPFGVLRRVEVARAVVADARLVLLDEPASGLDDRETDQMAALLGTLRSGLGISLLVIEHDMRFVIGNCDRIYVLDRGRVIASGPPDAIRNDREVIAAYLGEPADTPNAPRSRSRAPR